MFLINLTGILNETKMAQLNYLVETKGQDAGDVAHEFLVSINLVKQEEHMDTAIEFKHVKKVYGEKVIIDDFNLKNYTW